MKLQKLKKNNVLKRCLIKYMPKFSRIKGEKIFIKNNPEDLIKKVEVFLNPRLRQAYKIKNEKTKN